MFQGFVLWGLQYQTRGVSLENQTRIDMVSIREKTAGSLKVPRKK